MFYFKMCVYASACCYLLFMLAVILFSKRKALSSLVQPTINTRYAHGKSVRFFFFF